MRATLLGVALVVGCAEPADDVVDTDTDAAVACDLAAGVKPVATGVGNTEGLTIAPDGTAYVVQRDGGLLRLDPDGTTELIAPFDGGIGATWWQGAVWVGRAGDGGELLEIAPDGEVTTHAVAAPDAPNFLTPTPWGTLLVADDYVDVIAEYDPVTGETTPWAEVPSPNGMVFSKDGGTLWVASTFREPALWSIPVTDGAAGEVTKALDLADAPPPDGVALASDGSVLVALNSLAGRIVRFADGEATDVPLPVDLPTPASLAFGRGGWDRCAVLVTELFGEDVVQVQVGVDGFFPPWEEGPVAPSAP